MVSVGHCPNTFATPHASWSFFNAKNYILVHITEPSANDDNDGKNENYDDGEGNCDDNDEKKYQEMNFAQILTSSEAQ